MAKRMNKRGAISFYILIWVFTVLFILIPFYLVLNLIVQRSVDVSINTHSLEHHLLLNRVFYSSDSFFYTDPYTGRTDFEKVDITKFKDENILKNLFDEESNTKILFRIELEGHKSIYYVNKIQRLYDIFDQPELRNKKYEIVTKNKIVLVRYPDGREEKKLLTVNAGFCKKTNCG